MERFLVRRIGLSCVTLLVVSLAIFMISEVLPGDVATMMMGKSATEEKPGQAAS